MSVEHLDWTDGKTLVDQMGLPQEAGVFCGCEVIPNH